MKLSHEKIIQLSHRVISAIEALDEVEIFDEPNAIRQGAVRILTDLINQEDKLEQSARQRIATHKRTIPEGGAEWELLFRKYYSEELQKLGITPLERRT